MSSWKDKFKAFLGVSTDLNDDFFEELTDLLVEGDFGAQFALKTTEALEVKCKKEKIGDSGAARELLSAMLTDFLSEAPLEDADGIIFAEDKLNVILLLGVNGVGKTTTAAKFAARYKAKAKPLLAAGDTFRAAAIEQLKTHGERLGVRVVAHKQNADAAAVVHDALEAANQGAYNILIADTAGRMHTKSALVAELAKISRVIERASSMLNYKKLLVLDATTGSNALAQTAAFNEAVKLDGAVLTKFDSTARGGIVFPLAVQFKLPVLFVCNGEQYGDIYPFNAKQFASAFINQN